MPAISTLSGIIIPVRAKYTGIIPKDWTIERDEIEGPVDLAMVDFGYQPIQEGKNPVFGSPVLAIARRIDAVGSLGFAAAVLNVQKEGKNFFPIDSRGKHVFVMSRTVLLDCGHDEREAYYWGGQEVVTYFEWCSKAQQWGLGFRWKSQYFHSNCRLLTVRE